MSLHSYSDAKLGVALTKRCCPACGKSEDAEILLNTHLSRAAAARVEELHGKVVGYLDGPCNECKKRMKLGILVIVCDEGKSEGDLSNPYRTGQVAVIKEEAFKRIFSGEAAEASLRKRVCFMDYKAAELVGIIKKESEVVTN